jgi:hypothetical protein
LKLFTCLAHADPKKLPLLLKVLHAQAWLVEHVHVCVITNINDQVYLDEIYAGSPTRSERFKLEIFNDHCADLPSPWLLTWVHKKLMYEKFLDASYDYFMCIEDDMEVTELNMRYWRDNREKLKPYGVYPSFIRVEWNMQYEDWAMADSVRGDRFSVKAHPRIEFKDGYSFLNIGRTYQGMFLYDRELMTEHVSSKTFSLSKFVPDWQTRIRNEIWPLGLTEAAVMGLTSVNVPSGYISRNFIPYYSKYLMIDPSCYVHHLPDKYTNMPDLDHGKVLVRNLLEP